MKIWSLIISIFLVSYLSIAIADENIKITDAWVNEAPPMAKTMACYMEIHNMSDQAVMLRSITSEDFDRSEFHKTEIKNGMAHMSAVTNLSIKPHEKISFEPGKLHLMLINPKHAFKAGDKIHLTIQFTNDTKLSYEVAVKKMSQMQDQMHHDVQMDNHNDMNMDDSRDMHEERDDMKHESMPHSH